MSDRITTTSEAEDIVRRFDLAVLEGDLDLAMTLAHEDITIREAPGLPYAREFYVGRDGIVELMEEVGRWWEFVAELDTNYRGVSESLVVARIRCPRIRLRPTGREAVFDVTEWMTVRDGKVAGVEAFHFDQEPLIDAARASSASGA